MLIKTLNLSRSLPRLSPVIQRTCFKHNLVEKYEEEVKYPPIIDTSIAGRLRHERQLWYDSIKAMPTVEQKLYEIISKHDHINDEIHLLSACSPTLVGVPFQHYITRTHFIKELPNNIKSMNVDEIYSKIKDLMVDSAESSLSNKWRKDFATNWSELQNETNCGHRIIDNLLTQCCKILSVEHPHLLEAAFDHTPTISSYWKHCDFQSPEQYVEPDDLFKSPLRSWKKETEDINKQLKAENLLFQFNDNPYCTIRIPKPLPSILPMTDPLCATGEVNGFNYLPKYFNIPAKTFNHFSCIPGCWPGDVAEYPLLQVYTMDKMQNLLSKLQNYDVEDIDTGFGIMASFAWLNGLANHQGFTLFHDLTYPLVGQTILTNGREWAFFIYQLNTICFHADVDTKDRRNLCWSSGRMNLFETIEDGKLKGLNDDVFKMILKFVSHAPEVQEDVNLKPYLGEDTRTNEEILELRDALRKLYRNAPDPKAYQYEVPLWVRIYKNHPDAPPCPTIKLQ